MINVVSHRSRGVCGRVRQSSLEGALELSVCRLLVNSRAVAVCFSDLSRSSPGRTRGQHGQHLHPLANIRLNYFEVCQNVSNLQEQIRTSRPELRCGLCEELCNGRPLRRAELLELVAETSGDRGLSFFRIWKRSSLSFVFMSEVDFAKIWRARSRLYQKSK